MQLSHLSPENHSRFFWAVVIMVLSLTFWTVPFIGYTAKFAVGMDTNNQASVRRDKRAKLFLEPSNVLVISLLKGNSAKESVEKAKSLMKRNISKLRTDTSPDAKDYVPFLFNNYLALSLFGDAQKKI
jgi:predicted metal-dependent hydrolase